MKQFIKIEVPQGKKAVYKDDTIVFEDIDILETLTTCESILEYLKNNNLGQDILESVNAWNCNTFEYNIAFLRAIICACTDAEKLFLTKGTIWYPSVQFCSLKKENNSFGREIIGHIRSEGKLYTVVGGFALNGGAMGLSCFCSSSGVSSAFSYRSFWSVSSERVAKHISKYFGKIVFNVMYGGCNCDWEWVD